MSKSSRAWVIRWEWVGDHARVEQPVAAILSPNLGQDTVRRIVDALYAAREYTPAEMLDAARRGGRNPYPAASGTGQLINEDGTTSQIGWASEVMCGHNPMLVARLAKVRRGEADPQEVDYVDDARPVIDLRRSGTRN